MKLLQSMARLSRNPDFEVFRDLYLQAELNNAIDGCITAADSSQYQGAAQVLQKTIRDMAEAERKYLAKHGSVPLGPANAF